MENKHNESSESSGKSSASQKRRFQVVATVILLLMLATAVGVGFQNCSSQSPSDLSGFNNSKSNGIAPFGPTLTPTPTMPQGFPTSTPTPPVPSPTTGP